MTPESFALSGSTQSLSLECECRRASRLPINVNVRTSVPISLKISLALGAMTLELNVEGAAENLENIPSTHVDVDQSPLVQAAAEYTPGGGLSDAVVLSAPGVVADSNGFFHPLGDHAQTSFSIDNQPISDQQKQSIFYPTPSECHSIDGSDNGGDAG